MRTRAGFFMSNKILFEKPALSIADQIALLKKRNLLIANLPEAEHYLTTIGYYRLMAYFKPFLLEPTNSELGFKKNSQFTDILALYIFDRELRLLVTDGLERIEVALRAAISNVMSVRYGSHWYMEQSLFINLKFHKYFLEEVFTHLKRTKEDFIINYYHTYSLPEHPPSWMVMECLSFGTLSKIYSNLKDRSTRKQIGDILGQYSEVIKSWMKSLTYTRNLCAHHSRLWNRFFINKPNSIPVIISPKQNDSPFRLQAYIIIQLLNDIAPNNHWKTKLFELFNNKIPISFEEMGFEEEWQNDPIWKM